MKRVMVVDQHAHIREVLTELLGLETDLRVVADCAEGGEAVRLAGELRPDVVVMDPKLPDLDGAHVTRAILVQHPGARVLLLTGAPHTRLVEEALAEGAHGCLSKSLPYSAILRAVRQNGNGEAGRIRR